MEKSYHCAMSKSQDQTCRYYSQSRHKKKKKKKGRKSELVQGRKGVSIAMAFGMGSWGRRILCC